MKKLYSVETDKHRNFGLDLLRFIAIFTVLISHSLTVLPQNFHFAHYFIFDGVLIFFVLSGFLIGRIFIREFEFDTSLKKLINFWKRRWWRTLPAYYFTILLIIGFSLLFNKHQDPKGIFQSLFFSQNLFSNDWTFFYESWSLAIEEWFYLLFPMLFITFHFVFKNIKNTVLIIFFVILFVSLYIRTDIYYQKTILNIQDWDKYFRSPVITRLDSILMGVLGAWFFHYRENFFNKNQNTFFIIGLIIFISNKLYLDYFLDFNFYSCVLYFSVMPFSILLMIPKVFHIKETKLRFFNNIITKGSLISYSMYLLNLSLISFLFLQPLNVNVWIKFLLFWILTVYCSILMYNFIEVPFTKLREKKLSIRYSRSR